jgi:hypothetical protein
VTYNKVDLPFGADVFIIAGKENPREDTYSWRILWSKRYARTDMFFAHLHFSVDALPPVTDIICVGCLMCIVCRSSMFLF